MDKYQHYEDASSGLLLGLQASEIAVNKQLSEPIAVDPKNLQRQLEETKVKSFEKQKYFRPKKNCFLPEKQDSLIQSTWLQAKFLPCMWACNFCSSEIQLFRLSPEKHQGEKKWVTKMPSAVVKARCVSYHLANDRVKSGKFLN